MALSFKNVLKSINGISTPVFGISWNPPETDRKIVNKLFLYLEDKRVLFYPYHMEIPYHVNDSIMDIRGHLTDEILKMEEKAELLPHFRMLRSACRKYLDFPETTKRRMRMMKDEMVALGEFRALFGRELAQLSVKYGVDIPDELEIILPVEDVD